MKSYCKKPTTYEQQLRLLKDRGLSIPDEEKALRYLKQVSYYRFSAYFLPYQMQKDQFNKGVDFDLILDTYCFDRELRLIVFDCIERIEVAIRAQLNHTLAHTYQNSHWQDLEYIFVPPYINKQGQEINHYADFQKIIEKGCSTRKPEVFIKHYRETYSEPLNPPSWMCVELLTIGELSRLFQGLRFNKDKQAIASFFGLHHSVFESWLHSLTYVRNLCAHHARLWNRELAIRPNILKDPSHEWIEKKYEINQRVFYFLCTLKYLLYSANPTNHLKERLENLFSKYRSVPIQYIGIPSDSEWQAQKLWM